MPTVRLYLSSRRFALLGVASAAIALLPALSRVRVAFPSIIGGGGGTVVPLSAIAPLALALLLAWSLTSRRTHLTENAVRHTGWLDAALLLVVEGVVVVLTFVVPAGDWTVVRNVLVLSGLSALGTSLLSPASGAAAVTILVLFVVTYGTSAPGARFVRILQAPPTAPWPLALAVAVAATAAVVLAVSRSSGR